MTDGKLGDDLAQEAMSGGSVIRNMFPAYRVFIYGKEVTNDVLAVRVNQAGGSIERTAGSCSITLSNNDDRYIITHNDMIAIAQSIADYNKYIDGTIKKSEYNSVDDFQHMNQDYLDSLEAGVGNDNQGMDATNEALRKELLNYSEEEQSRLSIAFDAETPWGEIKKEVISDKLGYKGMVNPTSEESELVKYPGGIVHDYLFQEGDCIFHANDPVRVAFRDPFDSRVWYWMFAGFKTTHTEDADVNKSSVVTITCTDVTKMARYALVQLSTGLMDRNVEEVIKEELSTVASSGVIPFQEIFEGFTILEILETIFFGSESTTKLVEEAVMREVAGMDAADKFNYLINSVHMSPEEIFYGTTEQNPDKVEEDFSNYISNTYNGQIIEHKRRDKLDRLDKLNMEAVCSPRRVKFKRRDNKIGVNYYYYQYNEEEVYEQDKALGTGIKDLNEWNEIIHHRVREMDLVEMLNREESLPAGIPATPTTDDIITAIGTNTKSYPVGAGRVFYFAPSTLNTNLGDVLDRGMGSISSMHSHFRDRLSYIFDLATNIDFRFYATPKGDVVFEMPFFDFDPNDFTGKYGISDKDDVNKKLSHNYMDLFGKSYDGKYDDVEALTEMSFEALKAGSNIEIYNYEKEAIFDYARHFTIEEHEQTGFSNTSTDEGVLTAYRAQPNWFKNQEAMNNMDKKYQIASIKELIPTLGLRIDDGSIWGFLVGDRAAQFFCALMLNRANAEARNLSVPILPEFGMMVNRPLFWRKRNYYANIVSLQHSIVWNSNIDTTANFNQIRGWGGRMDENGKPIYKHFGGGNRPYNLAELLKQSKSSDNRKTAISLERLGLK